MKILIATFSLLFSQAALSHPQCQRNADCHQGWYCSGGTCVDSYSSCQYDTDCPSGKTCSNGACVSPFVSFFKLKAKSAIFYFYDDGGEHGYLERCEKITEEDKGFVEVKDKLSGADKKNGFIGKFSDKGELLTYTAYYYQNEKPCNERLKKARAWFDKEYPPPRELH